MHTFRQLCLFIICMPLVCFTAQTIAQTQPVTLKSAAGASLLMGVAVTSHQVSAPDTAALILQQFDYLTPEFEAFPQFVHPELNKFTFERADKVVDFAVAHHLPVTGHMLCWGQFTPGWMFQDTNKKPLSRDEALAHLKTHIDAVLGHFKGRVESWDVVNEAISDNTGESLRDTPARRAIGDDYIARAFEFAHAADPNVLLYYNDYNIEDPAKLPKVIALIRSLKSSGLPIEAVGIQGHWLIDYPPVKWIDDAVVALGAEGVKVYITELDVDVLPRHNGADLNAVEQKGDDLYKDGLPAEKSKQLARRYSEIIAVLKKHPTIVTRITFWGLDDKQSWLNDFPVKGRTNHPLLFDRSLQPKPALGAVISALGDKR